MRLILCLGLLWVSCSVRALVLEDMDKEGMLAAAFANKKIGYYIGSFDPPHLGHQDIAFLPIKEQLCDYVIVYPAWGGDEYKQRTPVEIRLKMLMVLFKDDPKIIVTNLSPQAMQALLTIEDPTRTVEGKPTVKPKFEGAEFIGIIGSDVALELGSVCEDQKKETERKKRLGAFMKGIHIPSKYAQHTIGGIIALPVNSFIVAMRSEDDLTRLEGKVGDRPILSQIRSIKNQDISSTAVKKALKDKRPVDDMVTPEVLKVIQENKLYF